MTRPLRMLASGCIYDDASQIEAPAAVLGRP